MRRRAPMAMWRTAARSPAPPHRRQILRCYPATSVSPTTSPFGLIASGPKKGLQFSADGKSIIAFNPGTTTGTGNANMGGDGGVLHNETLISADHNGQVYGRFDYDLTRDLSFYADARLGSSWTSGASQGYTNTDGQYPIWLYSDNAVLHRGPAGGAVPAPARHRRRYRALQQRSDRASSMSSSRPIPKQCRPGSRARPSATSHGTFITPMARTP